MVDSVSLMHGRLVGYQRGSCEFSLAWYILCLHRSLSECWRVLLVCLENMVAF